jgi:ribonuclease HII
VKHILGIDEAGRGPVIGPLVLAGVLLEESKRGELLRLGVKDSKQLSRLQRNHLAPQITALACEIRLLAITPRELNGNLTQVELKGIAQLIRDLRPTVVYLDAPVPPRAISAFVKNLRTQVGEHTPEIIAENRADATYPIVGAASILAKVHRDQIIEQLRSQYGDFGWGYPSERKTQQFLAEWYAAHGAFPEWVRARWRTIQRLIQSDIEREL